MLFISTISWSMGETMPQMKEEKKEGNRCEGSHALDGLGDIVIFSVTDVIIDAAWLIITGFVIAAVTCVVGTVGPVVTV